MVRTVAAPATPRGSRLSQPRSAAGKSLDLAKRIRVTIKLQAKDLDQPFPAVRLYNGWTEESGSYVLSPASAAIGSDHSDRCASRPASGSDDRDVALIDAIAHRDQLAFRELHARYYHGIARFVRATTCRPDLVNEITNDTLWVVWQGATRFRRESKVSTWIMGIARNLSLAALRSFRRRRENASGGLEEEQGYEPWSQTDVAEWLWEALARLPAQQCTVLKMFYGLGQSCEEISQALNCPLGTVKTRMFHGRRNLRELLPRLAGVSSARDSRLNATQRPGRLRAPSGAESMSRAP
jgi:RNA polymerase sigma-70 factor, ECF subfamily